MAKVATPGSLVSDSSHLRGGAMKLKRKTPAELRGELLKRRNTLEMMNSSSPLQTDAPKSARCVEMRLDGVYRNKKPSSTLRLLSGKATAKENVSFEENAISSSAASKSVCEAHHQSKCQSTYAGPAPITNDGKEQECENTAKCNQNRFLSVAEISLGTERFTDSGLVDMDKALKGLGPAESYGASSLANASGDISDIKQASRGNIGFESNISGTKVPVDLTLKTSMRIHSSSPISWLFLSGTFNGIPQSSSRDAITPCSWVYPQSSLPPYLISTLSSTGGTDFFSQRQVDWEDSFRNLYYLLRKSSCSIFYVYTSQFVVMFTAMNSLHGDGKNKRSCNAHISQSTRGLRSLLREHDVSYSMPLCSSEEEQISREDLFELSEIEKHNLGQAKRVVPLSDIDNSPQSILSFHGSESVHALYDFLLNYKHFLPTLIGADVPMLYSPVPFQNASLLAPEIRCKEIKTADHYALQFQPSAQTGQSVIESSGGIIYSIEVTGKCIPPWVVSSLCATMVSSGSSFEARVQKVGITQGLSSASLEPGVSSATTSLSFGTRVWSVAIQPSLDSAMSGITHFATDPNSSALNAALNCDAELRKNPSSEESCDTYGIPAATVSLDLQSAPVKGLRYRDGSYTVSLLPV